MAKSKNKQKDTKPKSAGLMTDVAVETLASTLGRKTDIDEVLRQAGVSRQRLSVLMADDEIGQAMETRLDAVINAPWRFTEEHGEQTQFLKGQIAFWYNEIVSGCWEACPYGYSVMEANYKQLDDGRITIQEIQVKPLEWFEPKNDGRLIYRNNQSVTEIDVFEKFPLKFFLTRRKPSYKQPYGEPLLSKLYWPWFFRTNTTKFWVKFLERFGSPLLVGKVGGQNRKQQDIEDMTNALLMAHAQSVISIGAEDSVDTIGGTSASGGSSAFEAFDTVLTRRIQKVVLGQTLTSGTDGAGSRALGQVHENVRLDKRNSDLRMITPTIQQVVDAICLINGFEKHTIILGGEQDLKTELVERDIKLTSLGVSFNDQYIADTYGIKPEYFKMSHEQAFANTQFSAVPKQAFSFKAQVNGTDPNQQEVDSKVDQIDKTLFSESELLKVVEMAKDTNDLQEKLYGLMASESVEKFNATMERALYLFDVVGYVQRSQ